MYIVPELYPEKHFKIQFILNIIAISYICAKLQKIT